MTQAKVEAVNKLLLEGEPSNISIDEHSGYTGYRPQAVVDAMNQVFWGEWGFVEIGSEIVPGEKGGLAVSQVSVWLAGVEFKPTSWGQNRVTRGDIGDARKGAQTDAIKKALSYFSIGNRAYQGLLKGDVQSQNGKQAQQPRKSPRMLPQPIDTIPTVSQLKEQCIALFGEDKWEGVKARLNIKVSDEDLSPEYCAIIARAFASRKAS